MAQETSVQPNLADLLADYLAKKADSQALGIATFDNEVTPYEVGPVQPLDPKLAWDEALAVLPFYGQASAQRRPAPPHWGQLVMQHESIVAIALCVGNFPQLMRNFHQILTQPNRDEGQPSAASNVDLQTWVNEITQKKQSEHRLLALGVLRLARQFEAANAFIRQHDGQVAANERAGWENEKAALAWHSGHRAEARQAWNALEQTTPVLFNRGMAALFANDPAAAQEPLRAALAQLPAASAWHHLGQLYLTMLHLRG